MIPKLSSFERCQLGESWHLFGLVEEVFVAVFDAVVIGDWEAVGVWVVDCVGAGEHGVGVPFDKLRGRGGGGDDGDELAEGVAFGAQVGGPLGGTGTNYQ